MSGRSEKRRLRRKRTIKKVDTSLGKKLAWSETFLWGTQSLVKKRKK